jgi:hypothetical protein
MSVSLSASRASVKLLNSHEKLSVGSYTFPDAPDRDVRTSDQSGTTKKKMR